MGNITVTKRIEREDGSMIEIKHEYGGSVTVTVDDGDDEGKEAKIKITHEEWEELR